MVRKIQSGEYLRRYDNMTADERTAYESRVGQWISDSGHMLAEKGETSEARIQNVLQMSVTWNDRECQAFEEGARLLSALAGTCDTWLPEMLYTKSAKRAIKQMFQLLWGVEAGGASEPSKASEQSKPSVPSKPSEPSEPSKPSKASKAPVPARPKHIDQYVHLLPKKTQEHAALVQGLYRELEDARQKLDLLMDDPTASPADREAWAKKATKCDNTLGKIFAELDAEWAKLVEQGRVVVDDLGNARSLSPNPSPKGDGSEGHEASEAPEATALTPEQRSRRRELRKWLIDTRRGNGNTREEYVRKWHTNFCEYLALEGSKAYEDEKIKNAARHYGIDLEEHLAEHLAGNREAH